MSEYMFITGHLGSVGLWLNLAFLRLYGPCKYAKATPQPLLYPSQLVRLNIRKILEDTMLTTKRCNWKQILRIVVHVPSLERCNNHQNLISS